MDYKVIQGLISLFANQEANLDQPLISHTSLEALTGSALEKSSNLNSFTEMSQAVWEFEMSSAYLQRLYTCGHKSRVSEFFFRFFSGDLKCYHHFHTREKRFSCVQSEWTLKLPGVLKCHQRIHSREKPYICDLMREVLQAFSCFELSTEYIL